MPVLRIGHTNDPGTSDPRPSVADANLISASPDLLAACKAVLALGFHGHFTDADYCEKHVEPVMAQLHAAIAKAEGS